MQTRRTFLRAAAAGAALLVAAGVDAAPPAPTFAAVCFDAFVIFDPRPIAALASELLPGRGAELITAWRTRQFEYCWLRSLGGRYTDFGQITGDALDFAARQLKIDLAAEHRRPLLEAHQNLRAWPDVPAALARLKAAGVKTALLSNFSPPMLASALATSGLAAQFDVILSTDAARTYKPAPAAYQLGVDHFKLPREQICFAAFAGWDVAGAKWFGYPTFWVNRLNSPAEQLDAVADAAGSIDELVKYVTT